MTHRNIENEEMKRLLYQTILACKTEADLALLLEDLCTNNEVEYMAQRVKAATMLQEGKTYAEIIKKTDISSATLSRVSRCVRRGSGGYQQFVPQNKQP